MLFKILLQDLTNKESSVLLLQQAYEFNSI